MTESKIHFNVWQASSGRPEGWVLGVYKAPSSMTIGELASAVSKEFNIVFAGKGWNTLEFVAGDGQGSGEFFGKNKESEGFPSWVLGHPESEFKLWIS
mmetsp:Transcript_8688/g.13186  ORF Transcript_8688/g.13186 Transcript_8688/m.13186 type:complete len:98 (-) Transcript_8688:268-561(-)|eukprot:CAMPEP_0201511456 /NCGR_PEP_ID=MMETSP0161_2-20130828/3915_1 /ASSEMBLY_ACC=CAM_ASM_000251 /TAXON_ID=180227 /ORGANISM="Neoparamoeba aestuarina, Strain SoJaBio B1-5/56/2" /LENGTH=97 /DNA_ID=CAMNT_0047906959 /DNA_START=59 /DNA_END=352 /DNA_ORIENTATION=+